MLINQKLIKSTSFIRVKFDDNLCLIFDDNTFFGNLQLSFLREIRCIRLTFICSKNGVIYLVLLRVFSQRHFSEDQSEIYFLALRATKHTQSTCKYARYVDIQRLRVCVSLVGSGRLSRNERQSHRHSRKDRVDIIRGKRHSVTHRVIATIQLRTHRTHISAHARSSVQTVLLT